MAELDEIKFKLEAQGEAINSILGELKNISTMSDTKNGNNPPEEKTPAASPAPPTAETAEEKPFEFTHNKQRYRARVKEVKLQGVLTAVSDIPKDKRIQLVESNSFIFEKV